MYITAGRCYARMVNKVLKLGKGYSCMEPTFYHICES